MCSGAALAEPVCTPGAVYFRSDMGAQARFSVEIADDAAEREQGLMNRDTMARSAGMLFVYPAPKSVAFWMKNTLIPLDMIFLDQAGQVTRVHSMAAPLDETGIPGGDGVQYVLEINGGMAKILGIDLGAEMLSPILDPALAKWPCPLQ